MDFKTSYISNITLSINRNYRYDAIIYNVTDEKKYRIHFGNKGQNIYNDKTNIKFYKKDGNARNFKATDDIKDKNKFLRNHFKNLKMGINEDYLNYRFLYSD